MEVERCLQNSKLRIELQIMVAKETELAVSKLDKEFCKSSGDKGNKSTIQMKEDFSLTECSPTM